MAVTLFVSYAPADDAFAQALTQALVEAGVDARAETFGPDGQTLRDEHDIILRDCAIFLPVLSHAALSSPRARAEARRFHEAYHGVFGRFMLPVLIEPLDLDEIWPFLQEYQRIEGPPGEAWSSDALIAGALQWVTLIVPARARTPSGALRPISGPLHMQSYMLQTGGPAPRMGMGLTTRPLGEALIAIPSERALQTVSRGRNVLVIALVVALILAVAGGGGVAALLLRGQSPPSAAIAHSIATATATATQIATATAQPSPTATTAQVVIPPTATPLPAVQASFVGLDSTTQGSWKGVYGAQGYLMAPNNATYPYSSVPGYAIVNISGTTLFVWTGSTADTRALQKPVGGSDRIAACWYSAGAFTLDIGVTDGQTHRIAFYFLDWDSSGAPAGRVERVDAMDATTGAVLDTHTLGQANGDPNSADGFNGGKYVAWNVRGHVKFTITNLNSNAVLSGVFFA
jgi:hypothetical protein